MTRRCFSLSANWHKQDSGIYSNWGSYDDFSIALNVLFGAKQSSFSPAHKPAVTPRYPILAEKKKEPEPPKPPEPVDVVIRYERVYDHVAACPVIPSQSNWGVALNGDLGPPRNRNLKKIKEDLYEIKLERVPVNYPDETPYKIYINDGLWLDLSEQHLGCHQRAHNLYINGKLMKKIYKQRVYGEYLLVKIDQYGNAHEDF